MMLLFQPHALEHAAGGLRAHLRLTDQQDVGNGAQPLAQPVLLKYGGSPLAFQSLHLPGVGLQQPQQNGQQRTLPAAGRAGDTGDAALLHRQCQIVQRRNAPKRLAQPRDLDAHTLTVLSRRR